MTYQANVMVNGVKQVEQVVYTQLFSAVPDQGFAPASGAIGLGNIRGEIGVVRTHQKRDPEPTTAIAEGVEARGASVDEAGEVSNMMEKRKPKVQRRRSESLGSKVALDVQSAGSALALLVAITVMIVV